MIDDEYTTDTALGVLRGCDCDECTSGDDSWCCRKCHDLARTTTTAAGVNGEQQPNLRHDADDASVEPKGAGRLTNAVTTADSPAPVANPTTPDDPQDPWALTPAQQADLDARIAARRVELAAIPEEPPW